MRIDLHCHTSRYSSCSSLTAEELIRLAAAAGLDGVCLTEHDRLWPRDDVRRLSAESGLVVLRGVEVTTELGHVLVFGVDAPPAGMFVAGALSAAVQTVGGLTALAHPARAGQPFVSREMSASLFDTVEVLNGSDGDAQNEAASGVATAARLPGIAGSDCHAPAEAGTVATVLPQRVATERELVAVLRLGQHRVERLKRW